MLAISDLTIRIAGRPLIEGTSVAVPSGARAGLVGRNGSGKTTLFRAISGEITPDAGQIVIPRGLRIGQVAQEAPGSDDSLIDIVLAADTERMRLMTAAGTETDPHAIADIHARLADIDAHSGEARAAAILAGLGFDADAQQRPAASFSGGWRMRVALAAVLFARPDILLLDEPTNYLDLEGTLWLESFIARYPGTVLVISHDRDLLNTAVNSILHLESRKLTFYRGGYDSFERQRAEKLTLAAKAREKQEARRKHLQSFVDRFRAKATKARQAQSRIKMIERLQPIAVAVDEHSAPIHFPAPDKLLSSPIIRLEGVEAGYDSAAAPVLSRLDLRIDQDDRIALLGANGNGKSTFARLLAGRLPHVTGSVVKAQGLKVAMFAQHQLDDLHPGETPVDHVRPLMAGAPESHIRARVARMGLDTARMDTRARDLSGGEKARLLLGLITFGGPHLIILDEPTNHLDIDAREALMMALNDFPGAVIVISHDRHLIEATVDRLWLVADGTVADYDGDIADYRAQVLTGKRPKPAAAAPEPERVSGADKRKQAADRRRELAPLQQRIRLAEAEMARLQREIERIDSEMAAPGLYDRDPAKGASLAKRRADAEKRLVGLEEDWLAMSSEYEAAAAG
ncbi:MAG: glycosyl transferase family 1 [Alphaproteobacteria bacterium]|nr:MAG: glycosyl transferase family 1 [Alphaproteobacteria bacterium]